MIKAIGFEKVLILFLLLAFIVGGVVYKFYLLDPGNLKLARELRGTKSELSKMRQDIDDLRLAIERYDEQKERFKEVTALGFFDPQDRVSARTRVNLIQRSSNLLSAKYTVSPVKFEKNDKAEQANQKILYTDMKFDIEALSDRDIYKFIYMLNYGFPGQINITKFSMDRDGQLNYPTLRGIGSGRPVPLIKAQLEAQWRTMVPTESMGSLSSGASN